MYWSTSPVETERKPPPVWKMCWLTLMVGSDVEVRLPATSNAPLPTFATSAP